MKITIAVLNISKHVLSYKRMKTQKRNNIYYIKKGFKHTYFSNFRNGECYNSKPIALYEYVI